MANKVYTDEEKKDIVIALQQFDGTKKAFAESVGVHPDTLRKWEKSIAAEEVDDHCDGGCDDCPDDACPAKDEEVVTHDTEIADELTNEEVEEITKEKMTPQQEMIMKAIRKNPKKFLALMKRRKYFHENNAEEAIVRMLNSGLGRRGRRQLCQKMGLDWKLFREMEDTVIEMRPERLTQGAKNGVHERNKQLFMHGKIGRNVAFDRAYSLITNDPIIKDEDPTDEVIVENAPSETEGPASQV